VTTRYRICVRGRLDASWSGRMAGLRITADSDPEGPLSTLEGEVRDQAELTGVLDTLSDLNLTLVSVHSPSHAGDQDAPSSGPGDPGPASE
jgi:hypothetical protein